MAAVFFIIKMNLTDGFVILLSVDATGRHGLLKKFINQLRKHKIIYKNGKHFQLDRA